MRLSRPYCTLPLGHRDPAQRKTLSQSTKKWYCASPLREGGKDPSIMGCAAFLNLPSYARTVESVAIGRNLQIGDSIMFLSTNSLALGKSKPATQTFSEARLLKSAKRGEPEAFEALCHSLRPRLLKIAFRITGNREDAEDAVQDSMMRAFLHLHGFHGNSSFSTWLTRIVMNSALMINRKNRSAHQISADALPAPDEPGLHLQIPDRSPNPEQTYVQRERKTILHRAIRRLRPRMRAVIEIAQFQELPIRETARILDISVAAAKGRFFHARAALRKSVALRAVVQARTEPAA